MFGQTIRKEVEVACSPPIRFINQSRDGLCGSRDPSSHRCQSVSDSNLNRWCGSVRPRLSQCHALEMSWVACWKQGQESSCTQDPFGRMTLMIWARKSGVQRESRFSVRQWGLRRSVRHLLRHDLKKNGASGTESLQCPSAHGSCCSNAQAHVATTC